MSLGKRIRDLRIKQERTITSLAEEVGVTPSLISQVERDLSSPSVSTLKSIALALDVPISYFFEGEQDERSSVSIVRVNNRKKLILPKSHMTYELLSPGFRKNMQVIMTDLEPGGVSGEFAMGHGGEEWCIILDGTVEYYLSPEKYVLKDGDCIYYDATIPHRVKNIGNTKVRIISAISPGCF